MHPLRDHGGVGIGHPQTRGADVEKRAKATNQVSVQAPPKWEQGPLLEVGGIQNFTLFSTTGVGPTPDCFHKT